jgi:class 3 adenylate cyclase
MAFRRNVAFSASEDRLERLLQDRLKPGADKEKIDERIWDLFGEEWAIMMTDLSGFSRGVEKYGIIHFLQTIQESERILIPIIEEHDGILLKMEGDSMFVIFRRPHKALSAALAMQRVLASYNKDRLPEEQILLCVGIGFGRVLKIGDADCFGAEVNAASKLGEDTAKATEILVTGGFKEAVGEFNGITYTLLDIAPPGASAAYRVNYTL